MGRIAFITGAGGYIGGETALALARDGCSAALCDIDREAAERTAARIRDAGGTAAVFAADVGDPNRIGDAIRDAAEALGGLDILVHAAGGSARIAGKNARYVPLTEQEDEVIEKVLRVNLFGAIYADRAAARIMERQGRGGRILNFSSVVGMMGLASCTDYAAAKGGIIALTKSLAKEVGQYGITVNAVAPGIVMRPDEDGGSARALDTNFLHRKCTAADIAALVVFLASEQAGFITGQTYVCDGGRSLAMKGSD